MNIVQKNIEELITLLKTNQHMKDKIIAQTAWDSYLKLLRFYAMLDNDQIIFMNKAKRVLLGNRKWI
tara:strand:- start:347 stop:547 length:201 start_codon:yes stop_codon:yes gene_type:complete